jgi:hypothetical protein
MSKLNAQQLNLPGAPGVFAKGERHAGGAFSWPRACRIDFVRLNNSPAGGDDDKLTFVFT